MSDTRATLSAEVIDLLTRISSDDLFGQAQDRFATQFGSASMDANIPEDDYDRMVKLFSAGYTQGWTESQTSILLAVLEAGFSITKPEPALSFTEQEADRNARGCGACTVCYPDWRGMYVCATCGNKRCPHATDCRHACTGSNERGGSMLGFADDPSTPTIRETIQGIRDAITGARPCCHSTGPNHHPACKESK